MVVPVVAVEEREPPVVDAIDVAGVFDRHVNAIGAVFVPVMTMVRTLMGIGERGGAEDENGKGSHGKMLHE